VIIESSSSPRLVIVRVIGSVDGLSQRAQWAWGYCWRRRDMSIGIIVKQSRGSTIRWSLTGLVVS